MPSSMERNSSWRALSYRSEKFIRMQKYKEKEGESRKVKGLGFL
jgi:hypothetical protein